MFIDEVNITIKSGKGGDGIIAFHREKHVPLGGPSGGDGGRGGSIIFKADEGLSTLLDLKYRKHIFANAGENGKTKNMKGKDAEDVIVNVPVGTIVYEEKTNEVLCDLTQHGQEAIIAKGGRGGRGNRAFATARNKAPKFQENGEPGEELNLHIELKLLADVGLVGFPSVGKSTLITILSNSRPKIADYPFTTLVPNLGVVAVPGGGSFVLADMPGLIEGASSGAGLGIQFLRHIERTRVLLHVVDMSPETLRDPYDDYISINAELGQYNESLLKRPQIIVASKMDVEGAEARLEAFKTHFTGQSIEIVPISAIIHDNLNFLILKTKEYLDKTPLFHENDEIVDDYVEYNFTEADDDIIIHRVSDDRFDVTGAMVVRLYQKSNLSTDEAMTIFLTKLRKAGLDERLRAAGAKSGDTVNIFGLELEFVD